MRFLDFFAGIGGFRKGMEMAGHECVGFCEYDKFAVASYTSMHLITDDQREYLRLLPMRKRQKEILKEEYRNGEWYANDVRAVDAGRLPKADCWCFGFPCQDISVAGKQLGFAGHRSSLFFATTQLIRDLKEEDRPSYLLIENVKNLLSVNRGLDFARLLIELDEIGYDAEWQVINSAWYVPQNRERVFVVGHLRGRCSGKVFPVERAGGENHVRQLIGGRQAERVYDPSGISVNLSSQGGGQGAKTGLYAMFCDITRGKSQLTEKARCLQARYAKGASNHSGEASGVAVPILTPCRQEKRQNGRRMKEDGEPMFTLTKSDQHGVVIDVENISLDLKSYSSKTRGKAERVGATPTLDHNCNVGIFVKIKDGAVYAKWSEKHQCYLAIRRLTPRECFRLQGWEDSYFDRAQEVNSDNQLYKQAGNGVTVPVICDIARRMR